MGALICVDLSSILFNIVRTYIVEALKADPSLSFDIEAMRKLFQLDRDSMNRHKQWFDTVQLDKGLIDLEIEASAATTAPVTQSSFGGTL